MIRYLCDILRRLFTGSSSQHEINSYIPAVLQNPISQTHIDIEKAYIEACAAAATDLEGVPLSPLTQSPKVQANLAQQLLDDMAKQIDIPHLDGYIHAEQKDASHPKVI